MATCKNESVSFQANASRNCHDPGHKKWWNQGTTILSSAKDGVTVTIKHLETVKLGFERRAEFGPSLRGFQH